MNTDAGVTDTRALSALVRSIVTPPAGAGWVSVTVPGNVCVTPTSGPGDVSVIVRRLTSTSAALLSRYPAAVAVIVAVPAVVPVVTFTGAST